MTARAPGLAYAGLSRSPSFSLGTGLAWLGHDCRGRCPTAVTEWAAAVWFIHLRSSDPATIHTLVEVDFADGPWSVAGLRELLREVNHCVHGDHILVRERTPGGLSDADSDLRDGGAGGDPA